LLINSGSAARVQKAFVAVPILESQFNPQITQINADFKAILMKFTTSNGVLAIHDVCCLICGNLRNLRTSMCFDLLILL
jgi:hypothetical protein